MLTDITCEFTVNLVSACIVEEIARFLTKSFKMLQIVRKTKSKRKKKKKIETLLKQNPKNECKLASPIFYLSCKTNELTTGTKRNWHPALLSQAGSLLNCLHQLFLVCKQEELVQAAASLNGMCGFSEIHAQDSFLNPYKTAQQREFQGDKWSGLQLSLPTVKSRKESLWLFVTYLVFAHNINTTMRRKRLVVINMLVLPTD